jgi:molybdopterin synthase sulfur carrier subunit
VRLGRETVVTVKFVGSLRSLAGKSKLVLKAGKTASLVEVMKKMAEESPKLKPALANSKAGMLILVNGKEISVLNGLETLLKDGDDVVFVPVIHGG